MNLVIVDYGIGNLASIWNMLKRIGIEAVISSDEQTVRKASKLILPGVGAFDSCVEGLMHSGLLPAITEMVFDQKTPILGICVGMQMFLESSEEGKLPGLGWIKGRNVKFRQHDMPMGYKIPHMGWTDVEPARSSRLTHEIKDPRFYFVHTYHALLSNQEEIILNATYGYPFVAAIESNNILGVQFHPEKSHSFGMKLLSNFASVY